MTFYSDAAYDRRLGVSGLGIVAHWEMREIRKAYPFPYLPSLLVAEAHALHAAAQAAYSVYRRQLIKEPVYFFVDSEELIISLRPSQRLRGKIRTVVREIQELLAEIPEPSSINLISRNINREAHELATQGLEEARRHFHPLEETTSFARTRTKSSDSASL